MDFIINLPTIGRAILQDFYAVGTQLWRFLSIYTTAFVAVGAELLPEVTELVTKISQKLFNLIPKKNSISKFPTKFSTYQSTQKISELYDSLTETERGSDTLPRQLVLTVIGIFLLGCAWFTLLLFIA